MTRMSSVARAWRPPVEMMMAAIAALALVATTVAVAGPGRPIALGDVGVLRPSMVDFLDQADSSTPLRLSEVRKVALAAGKA